MENGNTILITIRGKDLPGITSRLTGIIASAKGSKIIDIEQTVIHGNLLLSLLLVFEHKSVSKDSVLKNLLFAAKEIGVNLDFEIFNGKHTEKEDAFEYVITCLGEEIGAYELTTISAELARHGVNIDKIARLSHGDIRCVEMIAHTARAKNPKRLSRSLLPLSNKIGVDIAIQKYGLMRQAKRIVFIDMDSTLIQNEVIDELGKALKKAARIKKITKNVLEGKCSYSKGIVERVSCLAGAKDDVLEKVYRKIKFTDGAVNFVKVLKKLGYKIAIISGGFTFFTDRLKSKLGADYAFSNELEIKNGRLTGKIVGKIVDGRAKAGLLVKIAATEGIGLDQTIAIGDGANDIEMLSKAGLGIAFQAKPVVRERSAYSITRHKGLDSILYLLGIPDKWVPGTNHTRN